MSPFQRLLVQFIKFPGVGPKTARRYIYFLLERPYSEIEELSQLILELRREAKLCKRCFNFASSDPCHICKDQKRDSSSLCIVAKPQDIENIEKTHEYVGLYFILGGELNYLDGVGPEQLRTDVLLKRVQDEANIIKEIIFGFNSTMEGETTALHLKKMLTPYNIKMSRLARGLPMGSDIEYADEITLADAFRGRRII